MKAVLIKQGEDGTPGAAVCRKAGIGQGSTSVNASVT